jgi:hypothetical protein
MATAGKPLPCVSAFGCNNDELSDRRHPGRTVMTSTAARLAAVKLPSPADYSHPDIGNDARLSASATLASDRESGKATGNFATQYCACNIPGETRSAADLYLPVIQ